MKDMQALFEQAAKEAGLTIRFGKGSNPIVNVTLISQSKMETGVSNSQHGKNVVKGDAIASAVGHASTVSSRDVAGGTLNKSGGGLDPDTQKAIDLARDLIERVALTGTFKEADKNDAHEDLKNLEKAVNETPPNVSRAKKMWDRIATVPGGVLEKVASTLLTAWMKAQFGM